MTGSGLHQDRSGWPRAHCVLGSTYDNAAYGLDLTHADRLNAGLLAFIKS